MGLFNFGSTAIRKHIQKFANHFSGIVDNARSLFSGSETLKKIVSEENQAVQKSSSALEEISAMLERTADGARKLDQMSTDAAGSVKNGQDALERVLQGLSKIHLSTEQLNGTVEMKLNQFQEVIQSLQEIRTKTNVINDIVFQTKLLSFNASVEAARAGEHGKGFAVVADEMSKLAASSGFAAKEINDILVKNLKSTETIVEQMKNELLGLMKASSNDVNFGKQSGDECQKSFHEVSTKVNQVTVLSSEISLASQEQSIGVREISQAIHELQSTSDRLAEVADSTLKAGLSLSEQAEKQNIEILELGRMVGFEVKVNTKPFDFDSAVSAHLDWKMKLARYLKNPDGSLDPEKVCLDNACALGKWIYGDGQVYKKVHTHSALQGAHAEFHKTASAVIRLVNQKQIDQAEKLLSPTGEYSVCSEKCVGLIHKLKSEVQGSSQAA